MSTTSKTTTLSTIRERAAELYEAGYGPELIGAFEISSSTFDIITMTDSAATIAVAELVNAANYQALLEELEARHPVGTTEEHDPYGDLEPLDFVKLVISLEISDELIELFPDHEQRFNTRYAQKHGDD